MTETLSDSLRGLLGGSAIVLVGNVVGMGSSFVTRVVAARYLDPGDYGLVVLGVTLLNIVTMVLLLGLHQGLAQRIPRVDEAGGLFVGALSTSVLLAIGIAGIVLAFSVPLTAFFGETGFEPVLVVFALSLPLMAALELIVGGFRGLGRARHRVLTKDVLFKGSLVLGVAAGTRLGVGPAGIASAWLFALGLSTVVGAYLIARTRLFSTRPSVGANASAVASLVAFSLPLMVSGASWIVMRQVDNALLAVLSTSRHVGIYDAAYTLATLPLLVSTTFSFLFLPLFSRLDVQGELEVMRRFYLVTTKWMVFLVIPPATLLVVHSKFLLAQIYGGAYEAGSVALVIVVCAFFVTVAVGNVQDGIIAMGDNRLIVVGNLAALLTNVALNVVLIPPYGLVGAAFASFVSFASMSLFYAHRLFSRIEIHGPPPSLVSPALVAGSVFLLAQLGIRAFSAGVHVRTVLALASLVPYLALLLVLGGVDGDEVDVLARIDEDSAFDLTFLVHVLERFSP